MSLPIRVLNHPGDFGKKHWEVPDLPFRKNGVEYDLFGRVDTAFQVKRREEGVERKDEAK
jgi:hypothetical protein